MRISLFLLATSGMICLSACANEPKPEPILQLDTLKGKWNLQSALRDSSATGTLGGTWLDFHADGTMSTNMPLTADSIIHSKFELSPRLIRCTDAKLDFVVDSSSANMLVLATTLQNHAFKFRFGKE